MSLEQWRRLKGLSRVFSNATVQKHQFFGQSLPKLVTIGSLICCRPLLLLSSILIPIVSVFFAKVSGLNSAWNRPEQTTQAMTLC